MKKTLYKKAAIAVLIAGSLLGCRKDTDVLPNGPVARAINQDILANYQFDWENAVTMPISASATTPVYVPWRSQGGTPIDPAISEDYHKIDGWDLVYNSFSPDNFPNSGDKGTIPTATAQPIGGLYFALYNRYRGLLRYYLFVPPSFFGSSTQLSHGLQVNSAGTTSKMLNFEGVDIVDATANAAGFSTTSKDGISTTGGWYAMQYQIAYDPAFAGTTYPNPGFKWNTYSLSVTQIKLDGVEVGNIKGTITTPKPDFDWTNATLNLGLGVAEAFIGNLGTAAKTGFTGLQQAAQGGIAGSASGFLSGIFGGAAPSPQEVALTMNSTITTTGTANTNQPYQLNTFAFPGQRTSGTNGVPPLIGYSIGLFNLSARPTIHYLQVTRASPVFFTDPNIIDYYYSADVAEVQSLFVPNTAVLNSNPTTGAALSNFKVEVVALDPPTTPEWSVGGVRETIGAHLANTQYPTVPFEFQGTGPGDPGPPDIIPAVRVSFNIKSNDPNGPQNIFVVKTFLADLAP